MRLWLLPLAFFGVLQPASAAESDSDYSTKQTRAVMHAYAKCVVRKQPAKAAEAIAANLDNATLLRDYQGLFSPECLSDAAHGGVQMRFGGDLYRYALADALVNRELAGWAIPDLAALPPLAHRDPGEPPSQTTAGGKPLGKKKYDAALESHRKVATYAYLSRYGECAVRGAPAGSKALLLTVPDTPQESAAFDALRPVLERCMVQGQTVRFGRVALRGSIAINFYRLAHSVRARVAAK
ncbi:MAG TPA: hypothetical protein VF645_02770 [Allosphingosinicella sp.]|jgi:hypothetical protein